MFILWPTYNNQRHNAQFYIQPTFSHEGDGSLIISFYAERRIELFKEIKH